MSEQADARDLEWCRGLASSSDRAFYTL